MLQSSLIALSGLQICRRETHLVKRKNSAMPVCNVRSPMNVKFMMMNFLRWQKMVVHCLAHVELCDPLHDPLL